MGTGRFKDGKFDLTAVANFFMTADDWIEWERCFKKVSEILYNASEGQISFGTIFVCDDSNGLDSADAVLYESGDPSYSSGSFGNPGAAFHLMPYVKRQVLTLIHEMGHHMWNLGDEYCQPYIIDTVNDSNPAPDNHTIPILDSGRADNELANQNARCLMMFGGNYESKTVIADTATSITVNSDFSDLPTNADYDWVMCQVDAECAAAAGSNFCIMEKSRDDAGYFDNTGTWVDAANPVTEFCSVSNHDPDSDTAQDDTHGESCWSTIIAQPGFTTLTAPDPASGVLPTGHVEPNWIALDKQARFALVLDRSGSMATGNKMADAQYGAIYWLEFYAQVNDLLTIIWYDHAIERILDLNEVGTLPDLTSETDAINLLTPRGTTNIRDGLYDALGQIQTPATRAAVQVALLLTDGKHNTPGGSEASEVLPSFKEGGVRIYTLGVGEPDKVDMDVLDELADETGGRSYTVGDDQPMVIEAAMAEINAQVRGGIITTSPQLFPDSRMSKLDDLIEKIMAAGKKKRPALEVICKILGIKGTRELIFPNDRLAGLVCAVPVMVEEKCERVSFTLVYPASSDLWLFLIDPSGTYVDMNGSTIKHVISKAPHEFALVENPDPGLWYLVALRSAPCESFSFKALAGAENRRIQAFGGASYSNCPKAPVRIHASARFRDDLSNLKVTAAVTSPRGIEKRIKLSDMLGREPNSGEYEGFITVDELGRYHGIIRIENIGKAIIAKPARRIMDSEKGEIQGFAKAPKFVRVIPFYFDSGKRRLVDDVEKKRGLDKVYGYIQDRPTKLVSAKIRKKK